MLDHLRLTRRIQLALLIYTLATAVLLATALTLQLRRLADDQIMALGESLAEQLAEATRQPMLNGDVISIQAVLDQLVSQTPQVGRIAAYDSDNRLLSQSQRPGLGSSEPLSSHVRPVTVDKAITGFIRVELLSVRIASLYRQPLWLALATWLLATALFAWWLLRQGRDIGDRLGRINELLPGDATGNSDELGTLEQKLRPLLNAGKSDDPTTEGAAATTQLLLGITVAELDRLQNQLNASHFDRIMSGLDQCVSHCAHLFDGDRLHAQHGPLLLAFSGDQRAECWLKALSCARAIDRLGPERGHHDGVTLTLRCALVTNRHDPQLSPWRRDRLLRQDVIRLLDITHLAGAGDIVIDTNAFGVGDLDFCHLEPNTDGRAYQLLDFADEQEALFEERLAFLRSS